MPEIVGEDDQDTALLREMSNEARDYISGFDWCPPIRAIYLAWGVAGVIALFLFRFLRKIKGADDQLWVVVGDVPSAYFVVLPQDGPAKALERYCDLMEDWVAAVRRSGDLRDVFPEAAEPTFDNARSLGSRIEFLRSEVKPRIG
ncbi:MAG TPA: hypothetical protein VF193_16695 [Steroidobacter sp.]